MHHRPATTSHHRARRLTPRNARTQGYFDVKGTDHLDIGSSHCIYKWFCEEWQYAYDLKYNRKGN